MQVARDENNIILDPTTLGHHRLELGPIQVQGEGPGDLGLAIFHPANVAAGSVDLFFGLFGPKREARGGDLRPVELAQLDQTELDVAGLVLEEGLAKLGHATLDLLNGSELDGGDFNGAHGEGD